MCQLQPKKTQQTAASQCQPYNYPQFVFSLLFFKRKKCRTQPWKSLHLEPVTSFVCGLSPLPMSHSLASQGKTALQNFEPAEVGNSIPFELRRPYGLLSVNWQIKATPYSGRWDNLTEGPVYKTYCIMWH